VRNRQIFAIAAGGFALALVSACGFGGSNETPTNGGTTSGDEGASGGGSITYLETFTPAAGFGMETDDAFILTRVGCAEPLVRFDDGEMLPNLATSWEQVEPTAWEFTLQSANFQDGTPVTAEAVVGSLQYLLEVEAPPRSFNPNMIAGVSAVDERTVRVETPAEDPMLPLRLSSPNTSVLAPSAYGDGGTDPVGTCTGPFEITSVNGIESMSMVANDDWWGGDVALDAVEVKFITDGQTRITQLQTGEATLASNLPATSLVTIEGDTSIVAEPFDLPRTTALYFNVTRAPFDNPVVRQALRLAIDTQAIVDAVYEGYGSPAVGPFSASAPWAPAGAAPVAADPDAATAMLEDAGIDPASIGFELIAYSDRPEFADLAQVIQSQLSAIGVTVTITGGEWAAVEGDVMAGNYEGLLLSRNALTDIPDPGGFLTSDYTCGGGFNISRYCDESIDARMAEAVANADPEARYAIYQEVATHLQEQAVSIFLVHEVATYGYLATLQGFQPNPLGHYAITADLTLTEG